MTDLSADDVNIKELAEYLGHRDPGSPSDLHNTYRMRIPEMARAISEVPSKMV
ncbi:hypothetical protein GCM10009743_17050 [Kribbella swartbergensis]